MTGKVLTGVLLVALPWMTSGAANAWSPVFADGAGAMVDADAIAVNQRIDQVLGDHTKYEPVILAFQKAVMTKDAAAIAALVAYPLKVRLGGKTVGSATRGISWRITPPSSRRRWRPRSGGNAMAACS
ncbi:MAG TPA: hypothetical protein VJR95_04060 [Rhodanobacter sp.]|nr:hypothetical protein [Rhodanobacter sp.]